MNFNLMKALPSCSSERQTVKLATTIYLTEATSWAHDLKLTNMTIHLHLLLLTGRKYFLFCGIMKVGVLTSIFCVSAYITVKFNRVNSEVTAQ